MARPLSWLPRLHEIRRSVANSVRSHYDRHDLEQLFELQPRAAQNFFSILPSVPVGRSRLVEREALVRFLDGVQEADDVPAYLERVRSEGAEISRKKIRSLVRQDLAPADLTSLPSSVSLGRGKLDVSFRTVQELAQAMYWLAQVIETAKFAREFEPLPPPREGSDERQEVQQMLAELESMEAEKAERKGDRSQSCF